MSNKICEKAFSITKGLKPFDWNEFLDKVEYTYDELKKAFEVSCLWTTCACGNLCNKIPRNDGDNGPIDLYLRKLGNNFAWSIRDMEDTFFEDKELFEANKKEAKYILNKIEKRSIELLNEIELKKN